ncbi:hypothetical protein BCR33DRAFT_784342 [Rhizoclosmatium globosum]|uniref:SCP domain-containing protein n=1 Tax=Rhizoclosmatium globosum TaxID=329046 RepID=A0A1Y2CFA6_9FUNG|nr:hypothetical protein BCR33DRAFT_784342 [Rhizoclosmatium globosum]|eukprot:ORY45577.1 hypothetical protein BCR33DRAFT_784342 [Rhizoclosmatium globosum]
MPQSTNGLWSSPSYASTVLTQSTNLNAANTAFLLQRHNDFRTLNKLSPLTWSDAIAAHTSTWAVTQAAFPGCASSTPNGGNDNTNYGQNLAYGSVSSKDVAVFLPGFVDLWLKGPGSPGFNEMLLWPNTDSLGCAVGFGSGCAMLVCDYSLTGSIPQAVTTTATSNSTRSTTTGTYSTSSSSSSSYSTTFTSSTSVSTTDSTTSTTSTTTSPIALTTGSIFVQPSLPTNNPGSDGRVILIVAVVLGIAAVFGAILFVYFCCRRKRNYKKKRNEGIYGDLN